MHKIMALLTSLMIPSTALAGFIDGHDLASNIRDYDKANMGDRTTNYQSAAELKFYILGAADLLINNTENVVCYPSNVKSNQVVATVVKHLRENPEIWSEPGDAIVWEALKKSFPCP